MKINPTKPYFPNEDIESIISDVRDMFETRMLTQSSNVKKFEDEFRKYVGTRYAIATNSGTSSLEIVLRYFDIKDREVIVPTNTFIASSNAVIFAGGNPILTDINDKTLCISLKEIEKKLTAKTKGVIAVHIAGLICPEIKRIQEICKENNLFLLEDAAHAPGATIDDRKAGSLGDAGSFSFFPSKVITSGEGGIITTNDEEMAETARSMRHHGIGKAKGELVRLGYNWRMSEVNAIMGIYQLRRLEEFLKKRNHIAEIYISYLKDIAGVTLISVPPNFRHSYYKFPAILDEGIDRNTLVNNLKMKYGIGIGTIYWPPCHLQPIYRELFGYREGMFPVSEEVLNRTIALPIYVEMTYEEIEYVVRSLSNEINSI